MEIQSAKSGDVPEAVRLVGFEGDLCGLSKFGALRNLHFILKVDLVALPLSAPRGSYSPLEKFDWLDLQRVGEL